MNPLKLSVTGLLTFLFPFILYQVQPTESLVILDSILATKCVYYMKQFNWGCNSTSQGAKAYSCRCHNLDWIASVTNCLESEGANLTQKVRDQAYRHIRQRCQNKGRVDYGVDVLKYYQEYGMSSLSEATEQDRIVKVNHTLSVNATQFKYPSDTFDHIKSQVERSQWFAWGFIWIIVAGISIATLFNLLNLYTGFTIRLPSLYIKSPEWLSTTFLPSNRSDTFIICIFLIYLILATTTGISIQLPNLYQNTHTYQLLDLLGYRTALNSFALIPPLFFFGIRNNPFIRLTGVSISRFITYHKVLAWSMTLEALIHSIAWTIYTTIEGDYSSWAKDLYWQCGIVGMILPCLIIILSHSKVRSVCYEMFLVIHQGFSVAFIAMLWYHCNIMGWMGWLYATIVIWGYDRIVRFVSVLLNGGVKPCKMVKLNDELVRIIVEAPNCEREKAWHVGSFAYLYFLDFKLRFYQSHPFSVMRSRRIKERNCFVFVFKVKNGITKKLIDVLNKEKSTGGSKYVNVLMEGPYGVYSPLNYHDQYVFIAGGIGFTAVYSQIVDLVERDEFKEKPTSKKIIKLYWVVKSMEFFEFFKEDIEYLLEFEVQVVVYITGGNSSIETSSRTDTSVEEEFLTKSPFNSKEEQTELLLSTYNQHTDNKVIFYQLNNARPSLTSIVQQASIGNPNDTDELNSNLSTLFISSGPSLFNKIIKEEVRSINLQKDNEGLKIRVDYREESFEY